MHTIPQDGERCQAGIWTNIRDRHHHTIQKHERPCARRSTVVVTDVSAGPTRLCTQHRQVFERQGFI